MIQHGLRILLLFLMRTKPQKQFSSHNNRHRLIAIGYTLAFAQVAQAQPASNAVENGWVTVAPPEIEGAINNPLKGFRDYKKNGYGRQAL